MGNIRGGTLGFHGTIGQPTAQVIDGSLKFNGVNQHLTKTFSSSDNRRTFTVSYWIKESGKGSSPTNNPHIFAATPSENTRGGIVHRGTGSDANEIYLYNQKSNTTGCQVWTNSLHRDFSGWKHIVWVVDTTQATGTNRVKFYINGVQETLNFVTTPTQYYEMEINDNNEHRIGRGYPDDYGNYYLSQLYSVSGQTLGPENFGFTDPQTNTWRPKKYTGTFGTNGFYLPLDNQDDFEVDKSGNGNDFSKSNFSGTFNDPNVLKDSPSGAVFGGRGQTGITTTSSAPANYAVLDVLNKHKSADVMSNGNLDFTTSTGGGLSASTLSMSYGKFYFESVFSAGAGSQQFAGIRKPGARNYSDSYIYVGTGNKYTDGGSATSYGDSLAHGDYIGTAFDATNGTLEFFKNGVSQGIAFTGISGSYLFFVGSYGSSPTYKVNFGQKPFKYAPPQGYLPLNSATARPNTVVPRPDQYVGIITATGTAGDRHFKTPGGFGPDLVWAKERNATTNHALFDSVRGATKRIVSNSNQAEDTQATQLKSFTDDGFIYGSDLPNNSGDTGVYWCWKAGGSKNTFNVDDVGYASAAAAGLDGGSNTVTGASVGTKQGFSIIKYTGDAGSDTVSHGLTQPPDLLIVKQLNNAGTEGWHVMHSALGATYRGFLNTTAAFGNTDDGFGNVNPTSSVFTVAYNGTNKSGSDYIAFCWHDVPGLQKFGKYVGNNNADGPYVELGFRPALLWVKRTDSTGNWVILDTKREPFNPVDTSLYADTDDADYAPGQDWADLLSNGFKIRATYGEVNASSGDYIYCAWAEAPASNLFGGQSNAR